MLNQCRSFVYPWDISSRSSRNQEGSGSNPHSDSFTTIFCLHPPPKSLIWSIRSIASRSLPVRPTENHFSSYDTLVAIGKKLAHRLVSRAAMQAGSQQSASEDCIHLLLEIALLQLSGASAFFRSAPVEPLTGTERSILWGSYEEPRRVISTLVALPVDCSSKHFATRDVAQRAPLSARWRLDRFMGPLARGEGATMS